MVTARKAKLARHLFLVQPPWNVHVRKVDAKLIIVGSILQPGDNRLDAGAGRVHQITPDLAAAVGQTLGMVGRP